MLSRGPGRAAFVREALADGHNSRQADRPAARAITARWPWVRDLLAEAYGFHRRAARWAVTAAEPRARGLVFAAAGLTPGGGPLHALAAEADSLVQAGYCDADPEAAVILRGTLALADPYKVSVWQAEESDPAAVLGTPAARMLLRAGPAQVHVVLGAQRWAPWRAPEIVAGYAELLPPGSSLALSATAPGLDAAAADGYMRACGEAIGEPVYLVTPEQMSGWLTAAGMKLQEWSPGYAAAWGQPAAVREDGGRPRIACAVGLAP